MNVVVVIIVDRKGWQGGVGHVHGEWHEQAEVEATTVQHRTQKQCESGENEQWIRSVAEASR